MENLLKIKVGMINVWMNDAPLCCQCLDLFIAMFLPHFFDIQGAQKVVNDDVKFFHSHVPE